MDARCRYTTAWRDREATQAQLRGMFEELLPDAHVIAGKRVFNLLPPGASHKGMAFEHIVAASGAGGALHVGDDVTDMDMFRVRRANLVTVRIEPGAGGTAEFCLHRRIDMVELLDALIESLSQK